MGTQIWSVCQEAEGACALSQIAHKGCGVSIVGDIQKVPWATCSKWSSLSRRFEPSDLQRPLPTSTVL